MRPNRIILTILIVVFLSGCATIELNKMTPEEKAFKALSTSLSLYNLTMTSVADLQADGLISAESRARINEVAGSYRLAHIAASRALYTYKAVSDAQNEERLVIAVQEAQRAFTDLIDFVEPILRKGVK